MKPRLSFLVFTALYSIGHGQDLIEINETNWEFNPGQIVAFDGRTCLTGKATLKNTQFTNGIVEFDLWTDGTRSYPGINFRDQLNGDLETFYLRTHRMGLYDDAVQYAPAYGGMTCWQLYHGEGYTASYPKREKVWIHVKAVINQGKASFYLDNADTPTLFANLVRPIMPGALTFNTWNDHTYITNVKLQITPVEQIEEITEKPVGMDWQISRLLEAKTFDSNTYPHFYSIFYAGWEDVTSDAQGLVNISRYRTIEKGVKNCVAARKLIYSEKDQAVEIKFAFSDAVKFFLNEKLIYSGNFAYRSRGNSFTGAIDAQDSLFLNLKKGLNEIFMFLKEDFGGCGFIVRSEIPLVGPPVDDASTHHAWSTPKDDLIPEAAVYDPEEKVIYFTHFDGQFYQDRAARGYIKKVDLDGKIISDRWVGALFAPTGITLHDGKLYVVERSSIAEISIADAKIVNRYTFPDQVTFPNDIDVDSEGNCYITNSAGNPEPDIYRLKDGQISIWLTSDEISNLNGIHVDGDSLIVGDCYNNMLQRVDLKTKHITPILSMGSGVLDGIKVDKDGNILSSLWRGELYKIEPSGKITQIYNTQGKFNLADFEYIAEKNMILAPAFTGQNAEAFILE